MGLFREERIVISRRITPRRQGRRLLTALAIVSVVSGTFFVGATVLASTPANRFELEGNATSQTVDDWDHVCHQVVGSDCSTSANTNGATAVAWAEDVHGAISPLDACTGTNCTIFTGGGSKDPIDINQWAWKDNTGGLPDKDNLLHGFAARYSITPSASCPVPATAPAGTKCEMLFFGNDRYDNSGDAQQGFWFFQNKIGLGTNSVGGGNGFTSSGGTEFHRNGDLLLISDFSNGGDVSTITVYTWDTGCTATNIPKTGPVSGVSCGDANLRYQASSDAANCNPVDPAITGFCGIVNPTNGTAAPWPFVDKTAIGPTHPANTYLQGELYEGGVNLSFLGLAGECFASVASETRSSQSTTATLKDFVLGNFGDCTSHITTTPGDSTGAALAGDANSNGVPDVSIGTGSVTVRDRAVVSVSGVTIWSGSVSFKLCGPLALTPTTTNCTSGGVTIPYTGGANGNVTNASATKDSGLATLTKVGRYCWSATFTSATSGVPNATDPDPGNPPAVPASTSTTECFEVLPVQPTMTTQASGPVAKGGTLSDTATISGLATQPGTGGLGDGSINPTTAGLPDAGSITWRALGPNDCTTVAMASTSRTISGNGTYPTASQTAVSFTANAVGKYTFVAGYSTTNPNNKNIAESACPNLDHTEEAFVGDSSITTTPQTGAGGSISDSNTNGVPDLSIGTGTVTVRDHAVVSVTGITPWSGTVAFKLCKLPLSPTTSNCATGGVSIPFVAPATGDVSNTSPSVDSAVTTLSSVGRYCWQATFTSSTTGVPNSVDPGPSSTSVSECFEVLPVRPTLVTQASASVTLGNAISDTATISGLATQPGTGGLGDGSINPTTPGAPAGGSITWDAYGPDNCTTHPFGPTSRTVSGNGTYPTAAQSAVSFIPSALGTYTFVATYGGDGVNNLGSTPVSCANQPAAEKVLITGVSSFVTAQDWLPNDTATLTGDANLTGTLTFTLFNDASCGGGGGTSKYTKTVTVTNAASGSSFSTDNTTFKVKIGDSSAWSWLVSYDDANLSDPPSSCKEDTSITIDNTTP